MATKTILLAALVAATVVLPLASADLTVSATDPTTQQQLLTKSIGTNAVSCHETLGNQSVSPTPNCGLML